MMKLKKISIIIPTRNEKDNVGKLSEMIYDVLKGIPYNIVFVDDSTDDTWECIEELRQGHTEYNIGGEHRNNGDGLAGAVIRGISIADGSAASAGTFETDVLRNETRCRYMYTKPFYTGRKRRRP